MKKLLLKNNQIILLDNEDYDLDEKHELLSKGLTQDKLSKYKK